MVSANDIEECLRSMDHALHKYILIPHSSAKADAWKKFMLGKFMHVIILIGLPYNMEMYKCIVLSELTIFWFFG